MKRHTVLLALGTAIALAGCTGASSPAGAREPAFHPYADVAVTATVENVTIRNATDTNTRTREATVAPGDTVTLRITRVINRTISSGPGGPAGAEATDADIDTSMIQEGATLTISPRFGARPVTRVKLPLEDPETSGDQGAAAALSPWFEWEDGGFVHKRPVTGVDERTVTGTLPGLEEGDQIRTTVTVQEDGSMSMDDYTVQ